MSKSGWATLEQLATDPTSPHRFRALELLAAYAYGRPTQSPAGDPDPDMPPMVVTVMFDRNSEEKLLSAASVDRNGSGQLSPR
jgi:hypothetical protein